MSSNKYLLFSVKHEHYGVPIEKVREIIRYEPVTHVHDTLEYIKGVINLRDKVIPVFDLKVKFGMEEQEFTDKTVFIITDIIGANNDYNVALAVDVVDEVKIISNDIIKEPPHMGLKIKNNFLKGIYEYNDDMVMLLNIDEIIKEDGILQMLDGIYDQSSNS